MNLGKRFLVAAMTAAVVLAGATALPSRAGSAEWTDDEGDATGFLVESTPVLPSEPSLDVLKTTMASDDAALTWTIHLKALADSPSGAPGYFFRYGFVYEGEEFAVRVGKDPAQDILQLRVVSDQIGFDLPCADCKAEYDVEGSQVVLTLPIASLAEGIAAADSADCVECRSGDPLPPLAKGAEFTGLSTIAQRYYLRVTPTADISDAPAEVAFIL